MAGEKKTKKSLESLVPKKVLPEEGRPNLWHVYILECADGSYYTGIAKDLEHRLIMHESGKASRYTRARLPVRIRYSELCESRSRALIRECEVKAYSRPRKEALIQTGRALRAAGKVLADYKS